YPNGSPPVAPTSGLPANFSTATNQPKVEAGVEKIPTATQTPSTVSAGGDKNKPTGSSVTQTPSGGASSSATAGATDTGVPIETDDYEAKMKADESEFEVDKNKIAEDLISQRDEDKILLEKEGEARQKELDRAMDLVNKLHEQNIAQIGQATA